MALSNKLTEIYFRDEDPADDWSYKIKVKDASLDIGQVNYGSAYDEAIDGSLRTNIRGYRMTVDLPLNKLYDSLVVRNVIYSSALTAFLNDLITHFVTDGNDFLQISFDGTDYYNFIPDMTSYRVAYTNQIARASGSLKFVGQSIITSIPSPLQAPSV